MSTPRIVRNIMAFLHGFLARDRYLTEALAGLVTFATGVLALMSIDAMNTRVSLAGFRDMPCPEAWVILFSLPGVWCSAKLWWEGERYEGIASLVVTLSFVVLAGLSLALDFGNWLFWTCFALQLGSLKGYALIQEWTYLRWSMAVLGTFFWVNFTISLAQNVPWGLILLLAPCAGFAAANLLSVSRLSGVRGNA
ncbi:hypothetical protein [Roseomonas sp. BN140053]|uniref:hypothetical protein n=1 Tax=Roseomonas sp. BN140053 TaxID=3391898 RepID=UPI0039E856D7